MLKKMYHKYHIRIFTVIAVLAIIFFLPRFIHLDRRVPFDWDQEKLAYEVKNIITNHKLTLLGPRANNDKGFFLGPQFTYLLLPFFLITKMNPSAFYYFLILYNVLFFFGVFFILKKMFGILKAAVFLIFWSLNPILIENDVAPFWPIFIPFGVLLVWFILYRLEKKNCPKFEWLLLGLVLGFFFNMHFQFIFIFIFTLIFLFISRKKIRFSFINILFFLIGVLIMFSPLIVFDMRHHYFNANLFFHFFTDKDPNNLRNFFAWIPVFSNIASPFLFLKGDFLPAILFYGIVLSIIIFQITKSKNYYRSLYISSLILWIVFPIFFSIYGKRPSEYYFNFIYPFIILSLTDFFISRKLFSFLTCIMILFFVGNFSRINTTMNIFGVSFDEKNRVVKRIKLVLGDRKCDIAFNMPRSREVGYTYLFEYYGIRTIGDWKSCVININLPPRKGDEVFKLLGVTFPKELLDTTTEK